MTQIILRNSAIRCGETISPSAHNQTQTRLIAGLAVETKQHLAQQLLIASILIKELLKNGEENEIT